MFYSNKMFYNELKLATLDVILKEMKLIEYFSNRCKWLNSFIFDRFFSICS